MKIYDETKTKEITEYDAALGHLTQDKLFVKSHSATPANTVAQQVQVLTANGIEVVDGKNPDGSANGEKYKVLATYPNGGKDVEQIVEIPAVEAWDEYEDIYVFTPYTEAELATRAAQEEIHEAKKYLMETDYIVLKLAEAVAEGDAETAAQIREEYAEELTRRKQARQTVNEKEATLTALNAE